MIENMRISAYLIWEFSVAQRNDKALQLVLALLYECVDRLLMAYGLWLMAVNQSQTTSHKL